MAYVLGLVKPHVKAAADHFGPKYGIKTIYGVGPGSVPGSDHPAGLALDFMINNLENGRAVGDSLAADVIANWSAYNVKYVIWYKRIYQNGAWKSYSGPSNHTDHVHVSFNGSAGSGKPTDGGGTVNVGNPLVPDSVEEFLDKLSDPALWHKIGWSVVGVLMIAIGIILMFANAGMGIAGKATVVGKVAKGLSK